MNDRIPTRHGWLRPRNIIVAVILSVVGMVVYLAVWAYTARPDPSVDYAAEMTTLSIASQPPGENGWPYLVHAASLCKQVMDDPSPGEHTTAAQGPAIDFGMLLEVDAVPEAVDAAREALVRVRQSGAFDQLAIAARCPNAVRPVHHPENGPLLMMLLPEIAQFRHLATARAATMKQAFDDGDFAEATAAFDQILALANAGTHQTTLIDHLVGHAVAGLALNELRAGLVEHQLDAETMRGFQEVLDKRTPLGPLSLALEGERRCILDVIQRTFSDSGRGDGVFLPSEMESIGVTSIVQGSPTNAANPHSRLFNLSGLIVAGRNETTAAANEFYDNLVRQSNLSRSIRQKDSFSDSVFIQALGWRFSLLGVLLPRVGHAVTVQDSTSCQIAGTRLMLAIETYRAENGTYPASLAELAPGFLREIPADPFAANGEFKYRLVANGPASRGYLLHTVGADGKDDGGKASPKSNYGLNAGRGAGFDFVFNLPRTVTTAPAPDSESR